MKAEYIDHMGNDDSIVNAARISFHKQADQYTPEQNANLIRYLARGFREEDLNKFIEALLDEGYEIYTGQTDCTNIRAMLAQYRRQPTHFSPFAHVFVTLRMKAPIAIHAQAVKHQVGFAMNTVSRRYVSDTPEWFSPTWRSKPDGSIKQGSGCEITGIERTLADDLYHGICIDAVDAYEKMVNELNIAPEQARFILPQGVYTEWVWSGSLMAWARFYNQRTDPHAQQEIQELARMTGDIIGPLFPVSWSALTGGA